MSVLLRPDLAVDQRHLASAVLALAAADAVDAVLGLELAIKWPNDLLAPDGRKVAGVLAEADLANPADWLAGRRPPIVVGIGINLNWPEADGDLPADLVGLATSLRQQLGHPVDRSGVFEALLRALEPRVADLGTAAGRIRQVDDFQARCTTIGTRVRVQLADSRFEGTACAMTPEGHLVVETGHGSRTVVAGDVVHVRPGVQGDRAFGGRTDPE
jgi:BirA family biotin operon repressor/biotin-[acetyl-CoA-carboxylase] ligase